MTELNNLSFSELQKLNLIKNTKLRNLNIKQRYKQLLIDCDHFTAKLLLAEEYNLSFDSINKIIYSKI